MQPASIGPYTVVRLLGQGGMGAVYEVRHPEFPRTLALKVLKDEGTSDALARFGREAELLAKIRHPGVVAVHTLGRTSTGDPYLVTDLVEGQELGELTKRQRLEPRRCAELVRDLAAALEVVHAAGVIHRDLKPANVIVTPSGAPVILDFGIARGAGTETLTQTGSVIGTLNYMSPEQAEASSQLDARTDVYGLGAILFFLLSGLPPYPGSGVEVLTALVVPNRPVPDPREHAPETPPALAELCRRAIARQAQERTPTASALREELEAWLAEDLAPPPSTARLAIASAGLLVLGLALGGLVASSLPGPEETPLALTSSKDDSRAESPSESPAASAAEAPARSPAAELPADEASQELTRLERIWNHSRERPQERGVEPTDRPSPDPSFPEDTLLAELEAWLTAHPEHPGAPRARALSAAARRVLPLRVLDHGPVAHSPSASFHFFREGGQLQLLARAHMRPDLARWDTASWEPLPLITLTRGGERPLHDRPRASVILPPGGGRGRRILLGGMFGLPTRGRSIRSATSGALWEIDLERGSLRRPIPLPAEALRVESLARSPGGWIAVGTRRRVVSGEVKEPGSLLLLDPSGVQVQSWALGTTLADLAFPEDDLILACLREEDDENPSALVRWRGPQREQDRLSLPLRTSGFHVNERELLVGGAEGELLRFPLREAWTLPKAPPRREGPGVRVAPLSAFATRDQVLFCGYGGVEPRTPPGTRELVLWRRTNAGYVQGRRIPRPTPVLNLALSPEGRFLISRGRRNRIEVWDAEALARED